MVRTVALPLDGYKSSVGCRKNFARSCEANLQRLAARLATFLVPGERKPRDGQSSVAAQRDGPRLLLRQDFVNRYRALFLSRSCISKILSTNSREIATPLLWQRSTICCLSATGSLISSSNVAMICRLVGRGFLGFAKRTLRRRTCSARIDLLRLR